MNLKLEINKILKILFSPFVAWRSADFRNLKFKDIVLLFTIIVGILFVSRLVGKSLKYLQDTDFLYILMYSTIRLILEFVFFLILVNVINSLLPYYNLKKDKIKVSVLCLISLLPFYGSVLIINLFPTLYFLSVVSFYSFVIYYFGIRYYLKVDKERVTVFFVLSSLMVVGLYFLLIFVLINPFFDFIY